MSTPSAGPPSGYPRSSAWDRPGFLLWHVTLRWQRAVAEGLRPLGLTHVQFVLLAGTRWLEHRGAPPSQRELADHAGTEAMMTSQVVRALEERGLLERDVDRDDARVRRVRCTSSGADLAEQAVKVVEAIDVGFFGDARERSGAVRLLQQLARLPLEEP